jgi:hypothetical protein
MIMEAMRLSLLEHEAQQRREREAQTTAQSANSNPDSAPPREIANASPDPAAELQQGERQRNQPLNTESSLFLTSAGLPPSSSSSTHLQPNSSGALGPVSDNSSAVSPRQSFDESRAVPSSHRRVGSGPIQVASSPLNGAAALAMAFGFPTTPDESTPGNAHSGPAGFPPRTLNTLSAAVSTSSIPVAILGPGPTDRPETELHGNLASAAEDLKTSQNDQTQTPVRSRPPSVEHQNQVLSERHVPGHTSPPIQKSMTVNAGDSGSVPPLSSPLSVPVSKPTSNPDNPPEVSPSMDALSHAPVAERAPGIGNSSSVAFLTTDARTVTGTSVQTIESQQSKGDSYTVLPSSPETETNQPLMSDVRGPQPDSY